MRFTPILSLVLAAQLLSGCAALQRFDPWRPAPVQPAVPTPEPAAEAPETHCPVLLEPVCAEPEVKVVERVIERTFEKLVEVPVARDRLVLGSEEYFVLEPGGVLVRSLIDTGAAISSLGTLELTLFERDGDQWVRFQVPQLEANAEPARVELPVKRFLRVERPGFGSQRRPVVDMNLSVGDVTQMVEVSLSERSDSDHPLLVGRNFLRDTAVIDVSRRYLQREPKWAGQK